MVRLRIYEDAGISGSNGRDMRPGLERLLKDATVVGRQTPLNSVENDPLRALRMGVASREREDRMLASCNNPVRKLVPENGGRSLIIGGTQHGSGRA
jgi:hypothetical protein